MTIQKYVLVVDDEQRLTGFLQDFFSGMGYQMHVASSGEEAFLAVTEHLPSLILLDMHMPGIDGIEVLKTLKEQHPSIKIIVMTSYDEEYQKAALRWGADAFFPKPLSLTDLTNKIEEMLKVDDLSHGAVLKEAPADLIPKAKLLFVTVSPYASLLMKGAIHCVGDKPLEEGLAAYADAGDYELEEASSRKEVLEKLDSYKPDLVLVSVDWQQEEPGFIRSRHVTASELISEIMRSPRAPKEILLFGSSDGMVESATKVGGTALKEPSWSDFEKQAAKINRILWEKCLKLGLVTKLNKF